MIFDVVARKRHFLCGLAVGHVEGGAVYVTDVGQRVINRLEELDPDYHPWHVFEVVSIGKARRRVREAFVRAGPSELCLFLCKDSKVYDEVFRHLNLQPYDPFRAAQH